MDPADPATEIGSAEGMTKPYLAGSTTTLRQAVFAGTVDPGNIVIVREILNASGGNDAAVFSGPRADYDITFAPTGITVTHARGGATDGTDRIRNVEQLRFADENIAVAAPAAPTNVVATAAGDGAVNVSFTRPVANGTPAITGFEILVSDGTVITGIPSTTTSWTVTGLTNGTAYTFQVRAVNAVAASPLSAASNSVTPVAAVGPQIVSRAPAVNATSVAHAAHVVAVFDQNMVVNSFTTGTMVLRNPTGTQIPATVSYSTVNRRATLNPSADLAPNTTYTVTLTGGPTAIRSSAGVPLATTRWSFTTLAPLAPVVTTTTPAADAVNVARGTNVLANFSVPVTGVSSENFVLTQAATNAPVAARVTMNVARTTATLNPTLTLARNTVYRVSLVGGPTAIRASSGGAPLVNRSWSFTTAP